MRKRKTFSCHGGYSAIRFFERLMKQGKYNNNYKKKHNMPMYRAKQVYKYKKALLKKLLKA